MSSTQQNTARIAKNTGYLYLRMILVTLVNLYTSRVVLQALGFEDFGIYNVIASVIVFFSFFNHALKNATTRFLSVEIGKNDLQSLQRTYSMAINLHILLASAIFVLMEITGVWFINHHLTIAANRLTAANWVFQLSLLSMFVSVTQVPYNASIIAHERMNVYAYVELLNVFLKLGIVFLLTIVTADKLIFYAALVAFVQIGNRFFPWLCKTNLDWLCPGYRVNCSDKIRIRRRSVNIRIAFEQINFV